MPIAKPTDTYTWHSTPASEVERTVQRIRSSPDYFSSPYLTETYTRFGLEVLPDPMSPDVADLVTQALRTETPFSVIRLGDGELNLLSFDTYETPQFDRYCVARSLEMWEDSFLPDDLWMIVLREMMMSAVLQADIVGVLGLWRPKPLTPEGLIEIFNSKPHSAAGHWRGMDYMLRLAQSGVLREKILASQHLYFGLLNHLEGFVGCARRIILITSRIGILEKLRKKYPRFTFDLISTGSSRNPEESWPDAPHFLYTVASQLPLDMRGCLCLVGAGPWAEVYCSWIKQRGGVALDLGSGFDLLSGMVTRAAHTGVGMDKANPYAL